MPHITFMPCGLAGEVAEGTTLLEAADQLDLLGVAGLEIPDGCTRQCECCTCKVRIVSGWDHLSAISDDENVLLADNGAADDDRLSCQATIHGDVVVWFDGT
ncbi:MAG: ferredoxin [Nitrospirae bacterium CG18_big_fil_WC_8_21_14_2_50_70_55]|nr:2Fe-2S iron-sulfur cluster binding domain-containing protein [Deltaproteobacteria bacterium]OIP61883.1 MAG: hypothetical protein AUK30_11120 [Nitrospirae bacterium CG2_30_70_394]PIQ04166.1 MAG: ferredoxin [Nitrospirae bacterium CG18_big_fil_WC_8_21_14_2_50_70_55]PIU79773.1 MAG: ferredoxin [Nitrospirae bacterium CG06_land_8_20_14_3_00_70_43]PIW83390.1 MAG: ferredoxin [Nitrospirae bacterium CG_4_8_14_3_um_filter_70_85]PIX82173.1 MAG: ferredoxin [Nitrospirae bacterium CG_4_10_14_3_um_filter_70